MFSPRLIFLAAGLVYAAWCVMTAFEDGLRVGTVGMTFAGGGAVLSGPGAVSTRSRRRGPASSSAFAMSIGSGAAAASWHCRGGSGPDGAGVRKRCADAVGVVATTAAFAGAAAALICDRRASTGSAGR
jgi:hypothetical protein